MVLIYSDTALVVDLPFIQPKQTEEGRQMILLTLVRSLHSFQVIVEKPSPFFFLDSYQLIYLNFLFRVKKNHNGSVYRSQPEITCW